MGLVACHYSSLLKDGWWKISHNEDEIRNTVDYILFAIGSEGIVLFSRDVLLSFYDKNSTNSSGAKLNYFQGSNKSCPKGAFRLGFSISALFYKIKEFTITLPPLRECQNDILLLADFYLRHYNTEFGKNVKRFDNSSQKTLFRFPDILRCFKVVYVFAPFIKPGVVTDHTDFIGRITMIIYVRRN